MLTAATLMLGACDTGGEKKADEKKADEKKDEKKADEKKADEKKADEKTDAKKADAKPADAKPAGATLKLGAAKLIDSREGKPETLELAADGKITLDGQPFGALTADGKFSLDGKPFLSLKDDGSLIDDEGEAGGAKITATGAIVSDATDDGKDGTVSFSADGKIMLEDPEGKVAAPGFAHEGCDGEMAGACAFVFVGMMALEEALAEAAAAGG